MTGVDGWKLGDEEFRAVSALLARARYEHLVKRVADSELIWMALGAEGSFAVWPHRRYAEAYYGSPGEATPEPVELDNWLSDRLPQLASNGALVVAFPTPADEGLSIDPLVMKADLEDEAAQYE